MGLLALGTALSWHESRSYNDRLKTEGIEQLLAVFKAASKRDNDTLFWGDEIEYMMIEYDDSEKNAMLDVNDDCILKILNTDDLPVCNANDVHFHPEYGRFMLEATPLKPYEGYAGNYVEYNMNKRRFVAEKKLSEITEQKSKARFGFLTLSVFPRMGCDEFINVPNMWNHKNSASRSLFLPDEVINRHIRFPTLTRNIRTRRGEKVCINVPMYKDHNTPKVDDSIYERDCFSPEDQESALASKPGFIYLDAMGFGMGCSCLQATFQAPNIEMARYLYDAFVNFAPIMLAASAAAPAFKGWLADQDVRWNVISGAVDDRTPQERGVPPLLPKSNKNGFGGISEEAQSSSKRIPKSRYSTVDLYLGGNKFFKRSYNDTEVPINDRVMNRLMENHIAPLDFDLAKHFAHLYVRDPLVIFEEDLQQDNQTSTNHFENIQSTNWQTLRFKPPTQDATPENKKVPGWRVEFRPLEIQLTDFENAAYSAFLYLLAEFFLTFSERVNCYIPMSHVWENMDRAHHRDAVLEAKFFWKDRFDGSDDCTAKEYSINEIFHDEKNGIFSTFIIPILRHKRFISKTWEELKNSSDHVRLFHYLKLISDRASGKLPSTARFFRDYILSHPDYKHDSKISKTINYDLLEMCDRITHLDDSRNEVSMFLGQEIGDYITNNVLFTYR
ncbi:hypothetical protein HG535_0H01000 [Zygotorulaspora mrakii]|uniref:Glutamate--cysteine ligase n=1 Tax=Zygotorulaspora mrakii TaxID=42260 RepID=A0A7H9B941_ZYGMR|nr:uncharacterized protein HG535_0H01000 [Zygotorulaspora mrakii]QLG74774.1 hypothetical protein HG535_0H01000 [Zygotorulaspora mrakii]